MCAYAHWQMHPTAVDGGQAGLAALEDAQRGGTPFALVLLDARMPDMDGFAVANEIRRRPALAGATILMLTSEDRLGDVARCRELNVSTYLIKPITEQELLSSMLQALTASSANRLQAEDRPVAPPSRAMAPAPLRILLAEDNRVNQRLAVALLERDGHTVTVVDNGVAAVEAAGRARFDAILLDVQMPVMSGLDAAATIRAQEQKRGGRVLIIAMTAHAMQGDRDRCLAAGMDGYVAKPIALAALREALAAATAGATFASLT